MSIVKRKTNILVHLAFAGETSKDFEINLPYPINNICIKGVSVESAGTTKGVIKTNLCENKPIAIINEDIYTNQYPNINYAYNQMKNIAGNYSFSIVNMANVAQALTGNLCIIIEFTEA